MKNQMIHYIKRSLATTILGIMASFSTLSAQGIQDTIFANFNALEQIPMEKLYLHLDKPYYSAGEKIWFKGYLLNSVTHKDNALSNFIITELINRSDSIVERKKIRRDSLGFENAFTLPPTIPAGDYYLRGYSSWMQNEESDYFFSRNLKIGNAIDNNTLSSIDYQKEEDSQYTAKIKFYGIGTQVYANTHIRYKYIENGKVKDKGRKKTDENGSIFISLPNLETITTRKIEVEFDDPQYIYKKTFYLPTFSKEFNITFFPEGGALLAIPRQNIAFKVQGADGYSKKATGFLFNSQGDTLTNFRTEHDGMGVFTMNPQKGSGYYAIVTSSDGITKRVNLPTVETKGMALAITHYRQEIRYELQITEATEWPKKLFLLAHTRGRLSILQPITREKNQGRMNDSLFQAGITHLMLVDQDGNALSERLVFIPEQHPHQWQVQSDKSIYGKREKVTLQISAKDEAQLPISGSFSISITDRDRIKQDSLADNIFSSILLSSDLKGHIENSGHYFINQDAKTLRALDFLMMTHGWRKHQLKNVLHPTPLSISNFIEKGQTISGRIKGFFGNNVKKGPIFILAPKQNIAANTETDENGEFLVNIAYPDSTKFVIQARTKSGFAGVDIEIDPLKFAETFHKSPFNNEPTTFMDDYLVSARDQYYMEGGMRVYNLKEVVVTANRAKKGPQSIYAGGINTYTVEGDDLLKFNAHTVLDAIRLLPSISIKGGEVHIRNNENPAILILNDVIYDDYSTLLEGINIDEVASISLLRGAEAAILGTRGGAGAIVIMSKDITLIPAKPTRGIISYNPLGYSEAVEFYHPIYDTPEKKAAQKLDLRTTIYWNPELRLDAEGKATIEYYTPDNNSTQDIIIEGVDKNGKLCRFTQTIHN